MHKKSFTDRFPSFSVLLFSLVRWAGLLGILTCSIFAVLGSVELSVFQGFSPDGTPDGFVPIPTPLFVALYAPYLFFALSMRYFWISVPCLLFAILDFVWRFQSKERKERWNFFLKRQAVGLTLLFSFLTALWTMAALYDQRIGAAHFTIQNRSGQLLTHIQFRTPSGSIEIGNMLPLESRFLEYLPKAKQEKVFMQFEFNGIEHKVEFTGGVENTRKYYSEFVINDKMQGEFCAWDISRSNSSLVTVINESARNLKNVEVSGLGWRMTKDLPTQAKMEESISYQGPMIFSITYECDGKRISFDLQRGWGFEGKHVKIQILPDINTRPEFTFID